MAWLKAFQRGIKHEKFDGGDSVASSLLRISYAPSHIPAGSGIFLVIAVSPPYQKVTGVMGIESKDMYAPREISGQT